MLTGLVYKNMLALCMQIFFFFFKYSDVFHCLKIPELLNNKNVFFLLVKTRTHML